MSLATFSLEQLRQRTGNKWQRFGPEVIPCWVADMDFPLAEPIRRYLEEALEREEFGYPCKGDVPAMAEAFAARMQARFGWQPDPAACIAVGDVVQAIHVVVECSSSRGDGVVLQTPLYPPFFAAVLDRGREVIRNPLINNQSGWHVDVDSLRASITPGTRLLALCNPRNPSGRVFTHAELRAIADVAVAHDLVVMADEIHCDLIYPGARHVPFASLGPEVAERTITFNSATKAFNTAGLRAALVHFGSPQLAERFGCIHPRALGGLPCHAARITTIAWTECDDWQAEAMDYLRHNRDFVARFVAERMPGVRCHVPQATYLAWLDFRGCALDEDPHAFLLREARVGLSPGPEFGDPEGLGNDGGQPPRALLARAGA